jgi:RNA polymerase sigma-70 factor, ECF subfamily
MFSQELSQLIARTRQSDEAAAKELVERLYPTIIRIVRNHLPRRELEEDLSQEIFLKIFSKIHQYRADMPFEHWVSRISLNTCICGNSEIARNTVGLTSRKSSKPF